MKKRLRNDRLRKKKREQWTPPRLHLLVYGIRFALMQMRLGLA